MHNQPIPPFHLPHSQCTTLSSHPAFTAGFLGCPEGRSSPDWVDFNFYGHQIVAHLAPEQAGAAQRNAVDGHGVPVRHFGVVLSPHGAVGRRLPPASPQAGVEFIIKPYIRFKGQPGEQATMFFLDPSQNAIELKAFANIESLFAR